MLSVSKNPKAGLNFHQLTSAVLAVCEISIKKKRGFSLFYTKKSSDFKWLNMQQRHSALNLTCYHGFYPNIFGQAFIDMLFLYFLKSLFCYMALQKSARIYGDNLKKIKPNDLNGLLVPHSNWFSQHTNKYWSNEMNFFEFNGILSGDTGSLFNTLIK